MGGGPNQGRNNNRTNNPTNDSGGGSKNDSKNPKKRNKKDCSFSSDDDSAPLMNKRVKQENGYQNAGASMGSSGMVYGFGQPGLHPQSSSGSAGQYYGFDFQPDNSSRGNFGFQTGYMPNPGFGFHFTSLANIPGSNTIDDPIKLESDEEQRRGSNWFNLSTPAVTTAAPSPHNSIKNESTTASLEGISAIASAQPIMTEPDAVMPPFTAPPAATPSTTSTPASSALPTRANTPLSNVLPPLADAIGALPAVPAMPTDSLNEASPARYIPSPMEPDPHRGSELCSPRFTFASHAAMSSFPGLGALAPLAGPLPGPLQVPSVYGQIPIFGRRESAGNSDVDQEGDEDEGYPPESLSSQFGFGADQARVPQWGWDGSHL
jgi:hypothetical protein